MGRCRERVQPNDAPGGEASFGRSAGRGYQAVEKRDLRRWASSFVIAAHRMYASILRIRPPCISSLLTGLTVILFIKGLL